MKKKDIAIIGRIGRGELLLDGQTVKTRMLYIIQKLEERW